MILKRGRNRYYTSADDDDFVQAGLKNQVSVTKKYKFERKNFFVRLFDFLLYYVIAAPVLTIYFFFTLGAIKVKGKKNLKKLRKTGYVAYGNHTQSFDPFLFAIKCVFPRRVHVLVNRAAITIPVARIFTKSLGAIPLADTVSGLKNMNNYMQKVLINKKQCIVIYPEAHLWPYCEFVRNFRASSFKFAANAGVPALPYCITYTKRTRGFGKFKKEIKPKLTINILSPVFPDDKLGAKENTIVMAQKCEEQIRKTIAEANSYGYYNYEQVSEEALEKMKKNRKKKKQG